MKTLIEMYSATQKAELLAQEKGVDVQQSLTTIRNAILKLVAYDDKRLRLTVEQSIIDLFNRVK